MHTHREPGVSSLILELGDEARVHNNKKYCFKNDISFDTEKYSTEQKKHDADYTNIGSKQDNF